jgi:PAS domain S-box-containing protein
LSQRPHLRYLGLFYAAYVLAGGFGQGLAIIPGVSITFWPPAGIFVATLLLNDRYSWPCWVLAGCLAELTCNAIWFHNPLPFALIYFSANALEALTAAWLLDRFAIKPFRLESLEEVAALVVLGVGLAPMVGATVIATTDAILARHAFTTAWPLVWLGDGTGLLVSTPLALVAVQTWREKAKIPTPRIIEASILALLLLGVGALSFMGYLPSAYMTMPPLLWAAVRFQLRGAAAALALITAITAIFTVTGEGEFTGQPELLREKIVMLQTFLGISAVSALIAATLSLQHQQTLTTLKIVNAGLETRVTERTAELRKSERQLSAVLDALPIGVALINTEGQVLVGNEVFKSFVPSIIPSRDDARYGLWEGYDSSGKRIGKQNYSAARALRGERVWPGQEFLFHGDEERGPVWTRVAALPFRDVKGDIIGATAVVEDITERKRAEQALRAATVKFEAVFHQSGIFAGIMDLEGNLREVNDLAVTACGYTREQVLNLPFWETPWWRGSEEVRERIRVAVQLAAEGQVFREELRYWIADGSERKMDFAMYPICDTSGAVVFLHPTGIDITERKTHEQQTQLLMREVNHRSKNMLSLVQSIARQTAASKPKDFLVRFQDRIQALAAAQDLLVHSGWKGVDLEELVRSQLAHFRDLLGNRIELKGPPITINSSAAQTLGLALHELATNAGKYGALSNSKGEVRISWGISEGGAEGPRFAIVWIERGGPNVKPATRHGFGTTVIDRMSKLSLNATVAFDLAKEGLSWRLECLAGRVLEGGTADDIGPPTPQSIRSSGKRVLVVEDETLVAFELAAELEKTGFTVLGPAASVGQAMRLLDHERCHAAVLDINLGSSTSEPIAQRLIELGVPFITVSGYAPSQRPSVFKDAPFLPKPLNHRNLIAALERCMGAE